jgi:hypothetical protein
MEAVNEVAGGDEKKKKSRARKTSPVPTRIYAYGARPPIEGMDVIERQMRLQHRYKNNLVAIERARRDSYNAILTEAAPELQAIQDRLAALKVEKDAIYEALRRARAKARKRLPTDAPSAERVLAINGEMKALGEREKAQKAATKAPEVQALVKASEQRAADMIRRFRAECGLRPSGTYLATEASIPQSGPPPKFRRYDGSARVVVQTVGPKANKAAGVFGLTVNDLMAGRDRRLEIDTTPRVRYSKRHPEGVVVPNSATLHIRVEGQNVTIPFIMHRPLPADSVVKWVGVYRYRSGPYWRWEVQFTLESSTFFPEKRDGQAVAVDFGAKSAKGGRIVAKAVGTDGRVHVLSLPDRVVDAMDHVDSLISIRKREFNSMREMLLDWMAGHDAPGWLEQECEHMPLWRSQERMARLARTWAHQRFDGDDEPFEALEAWRRQDLHLWQWETSERDKTLNYRREVYRLWAKKLSREYALLVTEKVNFARIAKKKPEEADTAQAPRNRTRSHAAPSHARSALRAAFDGGSIILSPAGRSQRCPSCGSEHAVEQDGEMLCYDCGLRADADFARCWHLLADAKMPVEEVIGTYRNGERALAALREKVIR